MSPGFRRNLLAALGFGLIWASIQYTQGRITDLRVLAVNILVFVVLGALICWGVQAALDWYKRRP